MLTPNQDGLAHGTDLVDPGEDTSWPYVFVEHVLEAGSTSSFRRHNAGQMRSFLVIAGTLTLEAVRSNGELVTTRVTALEGWHAGRGTAFRVGTADGAVVVEAGTGTNLPAAGTQRPLATAECTPLSNYTVDKPWGHEVWYTHNLESPPYALKQIHMTSGHQSSLQSHRQKVETNYVVSGEATVLNGLPAPRDENAVVDAGAIPRRVHPCRSGWTSHAGILHRVIATSDYTSVEVSTPELDDVIRWQDDTGRSHGRIATEHAGAAR